MSNVEGFYGDIPKDLRESVEDIAPEYSQAIDPETGAIDPEKIDQAVELESNEKLLQKETEKQQKQILKRVMDEIVHTKDHQGAKETPLLDYIFEQFKNNSEAAARGNIGHVLFARMSDPEDLDILASAIEELYIKNLKEIYDSAVNEDERWDSQHNNDPWNKEGKALAEERAEARERLEIAIGLSGVVSSTIRLLAQRIREKNARQNG